MSEAWVAGLKVAELKDELKKRGLPVAGVKAVLAQRLLEAMGKDDQKGDKAAASEAVPPGEASKAESVQEREEQKSAAEQAGHAEERSPAPQPSQEPAVAQAETKAEVLAKPADDPDRKAPAAAVDPADEGPDSIHALLDEAADDGVDVDDEPAAPEPEPVAADTGRHRPKAQSDHDKEDGKAGAQAAKPASASKTVASPAAASTQNKAAGGKQAGPEGTAERKTKRQPIQFQPPERKQSASAAQQQAETGSEHGAGAEAVPGKAGSTPRGTPSSGKPEPKAAAAAAEKQGASQVPAAAPAANLPLSKRLQVDTSRAAAAADAGPPSAPPTAEAARTCALFIDGLMRPFTEASLRELLSKTGTVTDLWMPNLKTHAVVVFESEEQAEATRQATYLLRWPQGSTKVLQPKFITLEDAEKEKSKGTQPGTTPRVARTGVIAAFKAAQRERVPAGANLAAAAAAAAAADAKAAQVKAKADAAGAGAGAGVNSGRKAGFGEEAEGGSRSPTPAPADGNDEAAAPLPEQQQADPMEVGEEEEKILCLDDLFRKTTAKPPLYYLPLTDEQVAEKKQKEEEAAKARAAAGGDAERDVGKGSAIAVAEQRDKGRKRSASPPRSCSLERATRKAR